MNPPDDPPFPHTEPPPEFAAALASAADRLGVFGRQVLWYAELSSTNDLAAAHAEHGAHHGAIVIANAQTAGRGRQGRTWHSPPGAGLYVSIVLRPEARVVPLLTLAAGVAVADGVRTATGLTTVLKWPNDVYVGSPSFSLGPGPSTPLGPGRKLGGILAEAGTSPAGVSYVIVGVGLNVRPAAYPPEVASRATSLEGELGHEVARGPLLAECLAAFAGRYDDLQHDRTGAVLLAWRAYAMPLFGRAVEWDDRGRVRRGVAEDVDATGALVVRTGQGTLRVIAGDVRWI